MGLAHDWHRPFRLDEKLFRLFNTGCPFRHAPDNAEGWAPFAKFMFRLDRGLLVVVINNGWYEDATRGVALGRWVAV